MADSLKQLREFPDDARHEAGFELWEVQQGNEPSDWKPMPAVGPGVQEIRIHAEGAFRVIYVAKFAEAVYVLHAFRKKTQRTAGTDIEIARRRYRMLIEERRKS